MYMGGAGAGLPALELQKWYFKVVISFRCTTAVPASPETAVEIKHDVTWKPLQTTLLNHPGAYNRGTACGQTLALTHAVEYSDVHQNAAMTYQQLSTSLFQPVLLHVLLSHL